MKTWPLYFFVARKNKFPHERDPQRYTHKSVNNIFKLPTRSRVSAFYAETPKNTHKSVKNIRRNPAPHPKAPQTHEFYASRLRPALFAFLSKTQNLSPFLS